MLNDTETNTCNSFLGFSLFSGLIVISTEKMLKLLVIFLATFMLVSGSSKLPDFIQRCTRHEPDLNACAKKNARIAIPHIVQGYRPYNLPNMIPLDIPRIDIQAGSNLKITLTENKVYGLENTWLTDLDMQLDKKHLIFKVTIPKASIIGHYKMNGQILILPIRGSGPANVTLMNGNYVYEMDFTLVPRNGKDYLTITNHNITFTTTRAYYHFDNLFNGDSNLGNQMSKFLNENWKDVTNDLGSTVAETISSIITSIAQNIFTQVPYENLLVD